jgi:N-carbamoyl-L-amino-acid hydrolase
VTGMNAHAGPTPMPLRKDALLAASRIVGEVNRIALTEAPHGRGTVGFMQVAPNSRNVVPGEVKFSVDFRHPADEGLKAMKEKLHEACAQVEGECRVKIRVEEVVYFPPCRFDAECVDAVRAGAEAGGYPSLEIVSGAAHDAVYVARIAPTAMIFIPCKEGISHNELEDAKPDDLAAGCNVLLHAMLSRANRSAG